MALPAIAVCCSGQGSNLQAILDAIRARKLRARVAVVICDNPSAYAIHRALKAKVPAILMDPRRYKTRAQFDAALAKVIVRFRARLIVLAGFMRILSSGFVRRFEGRILNIHPALLPAFPGAHAVRDALKAKAKVTGVTVHFVDEQVDHGPVIEQEHVAVKRNDTQDSLLERLHRVEHRLYPKVIGKVLQKR